MLFSLMSPIKQMIFIKVPKSFRKPDSDQAMQMAQNSWINPTFNESGRYCEIKSSLSTNNVCLSNQLIYSDVHICSEHGQFTHEKNRLQTCLIVPV